MDGSFVNNVPGFYTPILVEQIVDFDPDQYGNIWYNVSLEGGSEDVMWLAKNKPEVGKRYWGHIEPTKSGARLRFKTDKLPEGQAQASSSKSSPKASVADYEPSTNARWAIKLSFDSYVKISGAPPDEPHIWALIEENAKQLLSMFDKLKSNGSLGSGTTSESAIKESPTPAVDPDGPGLASARATANKIRPTMTPKEANDFLDSIGEEV